MDDQIYYETISGFAPARWLTGYARERVYADQMRLLALKPEDTILDIGVSDVITEEANAFERRYPHRSQITCAGLGDGASSLAAYPGISYQQIEAGAPLPFADKSFSLAICNAVFEHVGSDEQRRFLANEMLRVARRVCIVVPNHYFPVEHHTAVPLLHHWPKLFRAYHTWRGQHEWADPLQLEFISARKLVQFLPFESNPRAYYSGLRLGPLSSNIICIAGAE